MDVLSKDDDLDNEKVYRKSTKSKSKHLDFRVSIPVSTKRLKSMFRSNKEEIAPKIEVSGPITCDLMGSAANDEYLEPINATANDYQTENPYDEVAAAAATNGERLKRGVSFTAAFTSDISFGMYRTRLI